MNPCLEYIEQRPDQQRSLMLYLYDLFMQAEEVQSKLAYGIPFIYGHTRICYLNPLPHGGVEVAFLRGQELINKNGLLQSRDRKMVIGVIYSRLEDVHEESLLESYQEALDLDWNSRKETEK